MAMGLLTLLFGITWISFTSRDQKPVPTFPATIHRDCAPWDGSAFTVSISMEAQQVTISIYQSPEIQFPTTFSIPDDRMSIGNALLILPIGSPEPLTGKVSFQRVVQDIPVAGLTSLQRLINISKGSSSQNGEMKLSFADES
jgi:hypothetical protein